MANDFWNSVTNEETKRIDATLRDVVGRLAAQTGQEEFRFVLVALRYRETTGVPLKVDVAKALGLPPGMPSQASHYVQARAIDGLACVKRGNELYVRWMPSPAQRSPFSNKATPSLEGKISPMAKATVGAGLGALAAVGGLTMAVPAMALGGMAALGLATGRAQKGAFNPPLEVPKSNALESFAYIDYPSVLRTIADYAEPEEWGAQNWVLKYRLRGLFAWLYNRWAESLEATRGNYLYIGPASAVMPLGLRDRGGYPMFLVMTRNRRAIPSWFADGNSVAAFSPPTPVSRQAWSVAQAMVWPGPDPNVAPMPECTPDVLDEGAITMQVISHLAALDDATLLHLCSADRVVEGVCRTALASRQERNQLAAAQGGIIPQLQIQATTEAFQKLTECVQRSPQVYQGILLQVRTGIALLIPYLGARPGMLPWQSPVATQLCVPSYNQRADQPGSTRYMGCMLPLILDASHSGMPSLALVIAHDERQGTPRVQTCLSLGQAYAAARVISPVTAPWLTPDVLFNGADSLR